MVGHRTESIYRRYAIVDEAMLKEGAVKAANAPRHTGLRGLHHPARGGRPHEARQFEYRPSHAGDAPAARPDHARQVLTSGAT